MICMICNKEYKRGKQDENLLCRKCDEIQQEEIKEIEEIIKEGHTRHCACRQVWGDGECECSKMVKIKYGPHK